MTRTRGRLVAMALVWLMAVALGAREAQASVPARQTRLGQCFFDSASGKVRVWWDEGRSKNPLSGADAGSATDGSCGSVPPSVPWMAGQADALVRELAVLGLPMTQSDKGIQRIVKEWSDHGSAAFDVYLDGARDEYEQARAECGAVTYYTSGRWRYRTIGTMVVRNFPAAVPDDARAAELRMAFMHELIHVAQCAITNPARKVSASNLNGAWIEAVPQAFALGRVGGSWSVGQCARESTVLSTTDRYGYGQWPFWYALLGPSGGRTYAALLRDVISRPLTKARSSLERALRKHFTTGQLSRALLAWMSAGYFGGTLTSTSGAPIAGGVNNLYNSVQNFVDEETGEPTTTEYSEPLVGRLDPAMGSPASRAVVVPVMGCAALLVSWPDDAQSVSVTASGAPGGDLASVMAVGIDAAPGLDPSAPCTTDGPRTVIALVNGQFTAPRICDRRNGAPVWVLIANGGAAPLKLTVTASAA